MFPLIYLRWLDAAYTHEPVAIDDLPFPARLVMHSCGFLVHEDDLFYHLATDVCDPDESVRHLHCIPKTLVLNCQIIALTPDEDLDD